MHRACRATVRSTDRFHRAAALPVLSYDGTGFGVRELAVSCHLTLSGVGQFPQLRLIWCAKTQPESVLSIFTRSYIFQIVCGIVPPVAILVVNGQPCWSGAYETLRNDGMETPVSLVTLGIKCRDNHVALALLPDSWLYLFNKEQMPIRGCDIAITSATVYEYILYLSGHGMKVTR